VTDVAIGCAGVAAVVDLRGTADATGRELQATEVCVADEIASAAELVMGKDRSVPAAIVRGVPSSWLRPASVADEIVRPLLVLSIYAGASLAVCLGLALRRAHATVAKESAARAGTGEVGTGRQPRAAQHVTLPTGASR